MKKFLLLMAISVVLSGCGVSSQQQPMVQLNNARAVVTEGENGPPSIEDGDLYIEALSKKDRELCDKIFNLSLRSRCNDKIK